MQRKNAFTLIELLVVVAIIAVLVAMLLPALNMAREKAKTIVCRSNQRSVAQVVLIYCNDNNGQFPDDTYSTGTRVPAWYQDTEPYYANKEILFCPSCDYMLKPSYAPEYELGFGMNYRLLERGYTLAAHKIDDVSYPNATFMLGDGVSKPSGQIFVDYWILHTPNHPSNWNMLDKRHLGGTSCNIAYADMHVDTLRDEVKDLQVNFDSWEFWCGKEQ